MTPSALRTQLSQWSFTAIQPREELHPTFDKDIPQRSEQGLLTLKASQ